MWSEDLDRCYRAGLPMSSLLWGMRKHTETDPFAAPKRSGGYNWVGLERLKVTVIFPKFLNTH